MEILYFARIRETVGISSESLSLPATVITVGDLIDHLISKGPAYAAAFENMDIIRVAANQAYVDLNHPLIDCQEIAFFPPMTGG